MNASSLSTTTRTRPRPHRRKPARPARNLRTARPAFSFTEVLFAVMVLGIGFIMVAAMFPVTIRQQQSTAEETNGAAAARAALTYLQRNDIIEKLHQSSGTWDGCKVFSPSEWREPDKTNQQEQQKPTALWEALAGNLILPENPRIAWVPLFRRPQNMTGDVAQVYIFVVQSRNRPVYEYVKANPVTPNSPIYGFDVFRHSSASEYGTLEPKPVYVQTINATSVDPDNPEGPDHIVLVPPSGRDEDYREAAAEGAYVVMADIGGKQSTLELNYMNGRVYQLGARVDTGNAADYRFELVPGNDMTVTDRQIKIDSHKKEGAKAYIVGRALRDPTIPWHAANNPYEGPAQDIAIYTSYIKLGPPQP